MRNERLIRFTEALAGLLAMFGFAALLALMLAEWAVGCGESYVDAVGVRHQNECLVVDQLRGGHADR